ncbi:hypothetical protein LCGC14_1888630 [marine sediment metagenome]|uniref:Uncharacterized protein n=1 Tax=marine sediment metagenome TaxID=412755 RepID=A0A0F9IYB9_9ZZZZ
MKMRVDMPGFVKIYGDKLLRSTLWVGANPATKVVWITMLALSDRHGVVIGSLPGLAHTSNVSLDETAKALEYFRSPDPYSQSKDHEGRRVEEIEGGWVILNYAKHREFRTEAQVKEAARKQKWRESQRVGRVPDMPDVLPCPTVSRAEAEADADSNADIDKAAAAKGSYIRNCVQALNRGMTENTTLVGEWIPLPAANQDGSVTWEEDGIPLGVAIDLIYERSKVYRATGRNRGPRSLKYFDAAVREVWEGSEFERGKDEISEALNEV